MSEHITKSLKSLDAGKDPVEPLSSAPSSKAEFYKKIKARPRKKSRAHAGGATG